ncbi:uncharacterized protein LOC129583288 [Paramacrobiotus metropolitanus]|uniref:uncharacterized protein LOC129583288 n=1 Tax=Paramacrobiotus metropolitanus TaxID=2943436 RepID=UPI002445B3B7|nr:uncharacterized protein LOC129583288 [Paramacrobiotus metropolitanus]XP_055331016.1 uncharacterized protein LOC129583288 [Paramacrobiotus metropolitanus]XP_055331017.1 uncharacterized protein LOC129583288 [Paramacrobiotus metropolitanus]
MYRCDRIHWWLATTRAKLTQNGLAEFFRRTESFSGALEIDTARHWNIFDLLQRHPRISHNFVIFWIFNAEREDFLRTHILPELSSRVDLHSVLIPLSASSVDQNKWLFVKQGANGDVQYFRRQPVALHQWFTQKCQDFAYESCAWGQLFVERRLTISLYRLTYHTVHMDFAPIGCTTQNSNQSKISPTGQQSRNAQAAILPIVGMDPDTSVTEERYKSTADSRAVLKMYFEEVIEHDGDQANDQSKLEYHTNMTDFYTCSDINPVTRERFRIHAGVYLVTHATAGTILHFVFPSALPEDQKAAIKAIFDDPQINRFTTVAFDVECQESNVQYRDALLQNHAHLAEQEKFYFRVSEHSGKDTVLMSDSCHAVTTMLAKYGHLLYQRFTGTSDTECQRLDHVQLWTEFYSFSAIERIGSLANQFEGAKLNRTFQYSRNNCRRRFRHPAEYCQLILKPILINIAVHNEAISRINCTSMGASIDFDHVTGLWKHKSVPQHIAGNRDLPLPTCYDILRPQRPAQREGRIQTEVLERPQLKDRECQTEVLEQPQLKDRESQTEVLVQSIYIPEEILDATLAANA